MLAAAPSHPQVRSISHTLDVDQSSEIPNSLEADGIVGTSTPPPGPRQGWETTNDPRPAPEPVRRLILTLSLSRNQSTKERLDSLRQQLLLSQPTQMSIAAMPNLWHLAKQCRSTEQNKYAASYFHMRAVMQFAIWVDQCVTSDNSDYTINTHIISALVNMERYRTKRLDVVLGLMERRCVGSIRKEQNMHMLL